MIPLDQVELRETGIEGDHYVTGGKRSVTLIQFEHLAVIASLANRSDVAPALLRRNLVIGGINILGLKNRDFRIGKAVLRGTGLCAPCSRMEENLGPGGYTAVRGHGGITARIINPAMITLSDEISAL